jgi:gluconolactonase
MSWTFEQVGGSFDDVLDGPLWHKGALLFCKVGKSEILRFDPQRKEFGYFQRYTQRTSGLAAAPDGSVYGAQSGSRRVCWFKNDGTTAVLTTKLAGKRHNHPHKVATDKKGRIWFTDIYSEIRTRGPQIFPPLDHCSILRIDFETQKREWHIKRASFDTSEPRGLAFSQDEHTLYVSDGGRGDPTRQLKAYPVNKDGSLGVPSVLHTFGTDYMGPHDGAAGMCVDAQGNVVVAAGSCTAGPGPLIYVFSPKGQIIETHAVPADKPTACVFGGANLDTLYVTTEAGLLYEVRDTGRRGAG